MTKIREIKDEVNYLTYELIDDCNTFMAVHPDKKDKAVKLIEESIELRNSLIQKINHPDKITNKFFKDLRNQLINDADVIFEKLRKLIK